MADVESAVSAFLAADAVPVERMAKKGLRQFDCRAAVLTLRLADEGDGDPARGCALDLVLRHAEPAVRPDDVLMGLALVAGLEPVGPPLLTRLAQGPWDAEAETVGDPLA